MKGRLAAAAVGAALAVSMPAAASAADPTIDAARAAYDDLGITQLPGMPSGRTTYRTYDEYNADMAALAAANPDLVAVKTAPYLSVEGRRIKYVEITNDVDAPDGKPVFLDMGAIHGDETAAAEDSLEFAYDVVSLSKTNPKVKALLDKVRLIDLPVVNVDGLVRNRRASCGGPGSSRPRRARRPAPTPTATTPSAGARTSASSPPPSAAPARAPSPRSRTRWTSSRTTRSCC